MNLRVFVTLLLLNFFQSSIFDQYFIPYQLYLSRNDLKIINDLYDL